MGRLAAVVLAWALVSCTDETSSSGSSFSPEQPTDAGMDSGTNGDGAPTMPEASAPDPTDDAGDGDAALDDAGGDDGGQADAFVPPEPFAPSVQCRADGDCRDGQTCIDDVPGGICSGGCSSLSGGGCPEGYQCSLNTCRQPCDADRPCLAGQACADGLCGLLSCSAEAPCPEPYVCDAAGSCRRPACGAADECPAPLTCGAGGRCVE